ncbi:hypothetical protein GCM10011369_23450 [Neiella marina]|uniref:Minor tail T domain-containing protein n=1 Tax=Neiella marina TaxID=508461 RepID=A0A8J2XPY7_9GAMM|nr:hypothetical protein [Neiella marina]GGA80795.1 hypothetical protein GCM10011369_23450 [Neiella marina]
MLANMSARQFVEWEKFSHLEPFGAKVDEFHLAALRAQLVNYLRDQNQPPTQLHDLMLSATDKPKERELSAEEIYNLFG